MAAKKDPRLARAGVSGYNKPKRTPSHPKKSHIVVAKSGDQINLGSRKLHSIVVTHVCTYKSLCIFSGCIMCAHADKMR